MLLTTGTRRRRTAAVYLVPHQDDEALTLGAAIKKDVADGLDVYAIIVTKGDAASKSAATALLGYVPTRADFSAARDREFVWGTSRLGAIPIVSTYATRQQDGATTVSGIVDFVKSVWPVEKSRPTLLRSTSTHDYHVDHRNCGAALTQLYAEGYGTDPRLMISGYKSTLFPTGMTAMGEHGDLTLADQWAYREKDVSAGWWGIAYSDIAAWFNYILDTDGASYWHRPL